MNIAETKGNQYEIIDFVVPYDTRVDEKESEKDTNSSYSWSSRNNIIKITKTTEGDWNKYQDS